MIYPVVVEVNTMKPFTHASPRLGELRRGSCKRLFYCPFDDYRPSCRTHNGRGWGTASTVGRYETEARAAKLVPFIERLAGVVAPRSMTEGKPRRLGASTKKQWGI